MDEAISQLIGDIYDAVIDAGRWPQVIDNIRGHLGFYSGVLGAFHVPHGAPIIQASVNVPEYYLERMTHYPNEITELWGGVGNVARLPLEEPLINSTVVPAHVLLTNRYVVEWARPQGLVDQVALLLAREDNIIASLSFGCHETTAPIREQQLDDLRILAPHLRRAVVISGLLESATAKADTFEAALSTIAAGAVLVDKYLNVRYANAAASDMLRFSDPIRSVEGRLQLTTPVIAGRLESVIGMTGSERPETRRHGMVIPAKRRDGTAVAVHVLPLAQRRRTGMKHAESATAAIFVAERRSPLAAVEVLGAIYELTPAETRIYELLVAGRTTGQIAEDLCVAPSTVKTHTLRLFEKTGQHTRGDLIRLVAEITGL